MTRRGKNRRTSLNPLGICTLSGIDRRLLRLEFGDPAGALQPLFDDTWPCERGRIPQALTVVNGPHSRVSGLRRMCILPTLGNSFQHLVSDPFATLDERIGVEGKAFRRVPCSGGGSALMLVSARVWQLSTLRPTPSCSAPHAQ